MTFLHPEFLFLMLPPVLVLFYFILTQKEPAEALFDSQTFARLRVKEKRLSLRQRNGLYLGVFILLIVAMAQPVIIEERVKVAAAEHEVMVALDISASMRSEDLYPSRLAVAKAKLQALIAQARTERFGVLAFGKDVYVVSPPTGDGKVLAQMIDRFEPDAYAERGTDIMALLIAADGVMAKLPHRDLVLLTDGGDARSFAEATAYARVHRIRLFILGTATEEGAPLGIGGKPVLRDGSPVVTSLNPALAELAAATGGFYAPAAAGTKDAAALLSALRHGAPGGEDGVREIEHYGQLYILPLGFALFLLLVATSSMSRREGVAVPPALLLGLLLGGADPLHAARFDYELLNDAKHFYETGQYRRAANAYYRYARRNDGDPAALYDSAHALYRAGDYAGAAARWKEVRTKERLLQFETLYNLGNAYAMLGGERNLEAAVKAYRKALYLQNDRQTRENLETVLGRLMRLMREKRLAESGGTPMPGAAKTSPAPMAQSGPAGAEKSRTDMEKADNGEPESADTAERAQTAQMSDFEASVWMKTLQRQTQTHLYRITPKRTKGGTDAAPW